MLELKGKCNKDCKIFIDDVEEQALSTIYKILDDEVSKDVPVRIMPDVHEGKGIVIGFTMPLTDRINPNHVGVDIGCGVTAIKIPKLDKSLEEVDKLIKMVVPMGFNHQDKPYKFEHHELFEGDTIDVCRRLDLDYDRVLRQVGTLGGGNHFLEIGKTDSDDFYLMIHSGSRNFGLQVCKFHADLAGKSYLFDKQMKQYLEDMSVAQEFAELNRFTMIRNIVKVLYKDPIKSNSLINTIHNYIDFKRNIIRKGAVSAEKDELLVIPMNMRDGVLLCKGKGNPDWNYSAPHGAGRVLSRSKAKSIFSLEDYEEMMKDSGVYSSCINKSTIDESPMVYKDTEIIKAAIQPTAELISVIKPILNIKASE